MSELTKKLQEANRTFWRHQLFRQLLAGEITPDQYAVESTKLEAVSL